MAYTPPPGNAVDFDFVNAGYAPPAGNAVDFVFGGSLPPPPPGSSALPSAVAQARLDLDDWQPPGMRRFALIAGSPPLAAVYPFLRATALRDADDDWFPRQPRTIRITLPQIDDDFLVVLLF